MPASLWNGRSVPQTTLLNPPSSGMGTTDHQKTPRRNACWGYLVPLRSIRFCGAPVPTRIWTSPNRSPVRCTSSVNTVQLLRAHSPLLTREQERKISTRNVEYYGYEKREFFALEKPDLKLFNAQEISLVDKQIQYVTEEHTATSISKESHDDIWEMARIGDEIPYYTVFSKPAEITKDVIEWAKMKIEERTD